jgi:RHS repeat-associated protein
VTCKPFIALLLVTALIGTFCVLAPVSEASAAVTITTVAGTGSDGPLVNDIPATQTHLWGPSDLAVLPNGTFAIADTYHHQVRFVGSDGIIHALYGSGTAGCDAGQLWQPRGVLSRSSGWVFSNTLCNLIVDDSGAVIAGRNDGSCPTQWQDGAPATSVCLNQPAGLAQGADGSLVFADQYSQRVLRVSGGTISVVAGNGQIGSGGDGGSATSAQLDYPQSVTVHNGVIYIADSNNNRIRAVQDGIMTTVAGNGNYGDDGDGGPATAATLSAPKKVIFDSADDMYIVGTSGLIRRVDPYGDITTVAALPSSAIGLGGDDNGNMYATGVAPKQSVFKVSGTGFTGVTGTAYPPGSPIGGAYTAQETFGGANPSEACGMIQRCVADPVNTATGNYWETLNDLKIPGRGPALSVDRTYNSLNAGTDGPFGFGWSFNYGMSVSVVNGTATVTQENGSQVTFTQSGASFTPTAPRVLAQLVQNSNGAYTFTRKQRELFTFDSSGALTSLKDLNGYTTTVTHPSADSIVVTDPAGRALTFTLAGSHVTSVVDPAGRTVSYSYDGDGNLTDVTDVGQGRTQYTYDSSHRLLTKRSPRFYGDTTTDPAPVTTNHYDSSGRVDSQTDPLGRQTLFDYTSIPHTTKVTDPKGNVVVYDYKYGEVVSETRAYGTAQAATWNYTYDPSSGGLTTVTDPLGNSSQAAYDSNGNITSTEDPLGHTTSATYDALNDVTSETDGLGNTTTYTYDVSGNLLTKDQPLTSGGTTEHELTTYTYGNSSHPGDITSVADPLGHSASTTRNTYGDVTASTDEDGNKTTFTYNSPVSIGWVMTSVSPKGNTTSYVRDAFGRATSVRDPMWSSANPAAHQQSTAYDDDGNVTSITDGNGQVTTYTYNNADEVISTRRPDGSVFHNDYWPDGTLKAQYDGLNHATAYAYDALGHNTSVTDPLGRVTSFGYDAAGNRTTETDPGGSCASSPGTGCTRLKYDKAGKLTSITYSDGTTPNVSFTYDANGRRASMSDGTGTSRYAYDSLGRLTQSVNGAGATVSYAYDRANRQTSITYPNGKTVTRSYDHAGHITGVSDWLGKTTTFSWDADGHLVTENFPNSVISSMTFDNSGAITNIKHAKGATTLANLVYTRDGGGLLASTTATGVGVNETYKHDPVSRIKSVNTTSYSYDNADDITALGSTTQTFDAANELTKTLAGKTSTSFTYDSRGNRLTSGSGKSGRAYTYDQANRLTTVGGSATASYTYNGDGLRMSKKVGKTTSAFSWDVSGLPLVLSDGTWNYVYGPNGAPIEQIDASNTAQYLHGDQLGSVRLVTNTTGANVATYTYDAWGKTTTKSGRATTQLQYAGQYADAETGLIYLRARYYDPTTAQFLTRDPLVAKTQAPYAYASNSPFSYTDPTGNIGFAVAMIGAITGAVVAGVGYYVMGHENGDSLGAALAGGAVGGFVGGFCEENGGFLAGSWCGLASSEASTFVQDAINHKLGDFSSDLITSATVGYVGGKYLGLDNIIAPTPGRLPSKLSWNNIAAVKPNAERTYLNGTVSGVLSSSANRIIPHIGDITYASYGDRTDGCARW